SRGVARVGVTVRAGVERVMGHGTGSFGPSGGHRRVGRRAGRPPGRGSVRSGKTALSGPGTIPEPNASELVLGSFGEGAHRPATAHPAPQNPQTAVGFVAHVPRLVRPQRMGTQVTIFHGVTVASNGALPIREHEPASFRQTIPPRGPSRCGGV